MDLDAGTLVYLVMDAGITYSSDVAYFFSVNQEKLHSFPSHVAINHKSSGFQVPN